MVKIKKKGNMGDIGKKGNKYWKMKEIGVDMKVIRKIKKRKKNKLNKNS